MIYLLRHGETVWNREGRKQGHLDSPLTLRGVELATRYADWLSTRLPPERRSSLRLHSSPLQRAWQTAVILADRLGIPERDRTTSPLLREQHFGSWQGCTEAELEARCPSELARWRGDRWAVPVPGGESVADLHARASQWLAQPREEDVTLVVAHGVLSRTLRGAYLGLASREVLELESHRHGLVFELADGRCQALQI